MVMAAAERIAEAEGLHGLGARKIMREVGYTIGTFYQLFERFDDLVIELNGRTLDALYDHLSNLRLEDDPDIAARALVAGYVGFTRDHPKLWSILFEHHLPGGEEPPEWHHQKILRLLGLVEQALARFFPPGQEAKRHHTARVLWSSLHGICSLESAGKLVKTETVEAMSETLISFFLAGLRVSRPDLDVSADVGSADVAD
jgi:AcrR family transcriptional regulator